MEQAAPKNTLRKRLLRSASKPLGKTAIKPIHLLVVDALLVLLAYGLFIRTHYSLDGYRYLYDPQANLEIFLGAGRPVAAGIDWLSEALGIHAVFSQPFYTYWLMAVIVLCCWWLSLKLLREMESPSLSQIIVVQTAALLTYVNVFFTPWFMYADCSSHMVAAIPLTTAAIGCAGSKNQWAGSFLAFFCLLCALCIYQVYFVVFGALALLLAMMKHRFAVDRKALWQYLRVLLIALAAVVASLIIGKIIAPFVPATDGRSASFSLSLIKQNARSIVQFQPTLWVEAYGLLPKYTFLGFGAALLTCLAYAGLRKPKRLHVGFLLLLAAAGIGLVMALSPHLVVGQFWMPERTLFPLFSVFLLWAVGAVALCGQRKLHRWVAGFCVCFLALNSWAIQNMAMDQMIVNALDKQYAIQVGQVIAEHEKATQTEVSRIATARDADPALYYSDFTRFYEMDTNVSAKSIGWSLPYLISFYGGHDIVFVDMPPDIYAAHYEGKNWNAFDPAQVVVEGDTAYICAY